MDLNVLRNQPSFLRLLAFTEMWERFSYYGLLALLVIFLTDKHHFADSTAYTIFGVYMTLAYFGPLIGGYLADRFFGSQRMLVSGGSLIVLGHFTIGLSALHFDLFFLGLGLVAIGTGMFKGNIMTLLSQCYQESDYDTNERERGFALFYVGINAGAAIASIACGYAAETIGWGVGFALAGVGMFFGLVIFVRYRALLKDTGKLPENAKQGTTWYQRLSISILTISGFIVSLGAMQLIKHGEYLTDMKEVLGVIFLIGLITFIARIQPRFRRQVIAIIIVCFFALLFFAVEHQLFALLSLFAKRNVSHDILGLYMPAQVFQAINPVTIIVFGIALSSFFAKTGLKFSMPRIIIGFSLTMLCFLLLYVACFTANEQSIVGFGFMALAILLMSVGEVFLAPSIFGLVPFLAPDALRNTMMGACMVGISFSNISSFIFARIAAVPKNHGVIDAANALAIYQRNFLMITIYCLCVIVFVLLTSKFLHNVIMKRVHELEEKPVAG